MWCKCQLDYLCTLLNDAERREALKHLPRDLPATYIRTLERLERDYPPQTTGLIRKALKWLVLQQEDSGYRSHLTLPRLVHAVSLGNEAFLDYGRIPDERDLVDWCSNLVRLNTKTHRLELSHFTVKEFLLEEPKRISSEIARQYLVDPSADMAYLADTYLLYLALEDFDQTRVIMEQRTFDDFTTNYAFYAHAALQFTKYLALVGPDPGDSIAYRRFFSMRTPGILATWKSFLKAPDIPSYQLKDISNDQMWFSTPYLREGYSDEKARFVHSAHNSWTALQLSSALLLSTTTNRLLEEDATLIETDEYPASPLHLCIAGPFQLSHCHHGWNRVGPVGKGGVSQDIIAEQGSPRFAIVNSLLLAGAKANKLSQAGYPLYKGGSLPLTPFCVAILHLYEDLCKLLIDCGGTWSANLGSDYSMIYSVMTSIHQSNGDLSKLNRTLDLLLSLPELGD